MWYSGLEPTDGHSRRETGRGPPKTFADWKTVNREGVIYYLREGRVRGVLLWNVWGQVDAARKLIAGHRAFRPGDLKGTLPEAA